MRKLGVLAFIALLPISALAGEYLEPEEVSEQSIAGYDRTVKLVFQDAFKDDVRARAVVEPSFQTEFVVGIAQKAGDYEIFSLEADDQVWQYATLQMLKNGQESVKKNDGTDGTAEEIRQIEARLPRDPRDLRVRRCDIAIEHSLGERVVGLWKKVLMQVKPQPRTLGLDGEFFHFSMNIDGKEWSAQTWSPPDNSQAGNMAHIAYTMRDACEKDHGKVRLIDQLVTSLGNQLQ